MRLWLAALSAAVGGYALRLAYPGAAIWWLGLVGVLLIAAALWTQRARHGLWLGLIAGATFWLPLISWLTLYLGLIPWLALSSVMIAWFALFGALVAAATRALHQLRMPPLATIFAQSLTVAGLWVAREQVQSSWPYGGFAWGRLAHTQADAPWHAVVSWTGFAGLSGLLVLLSVLPVASLRATGAAWGRIIPTALTVVTMGALTVVPPALLNPTGTANVAAVQGNSKSGVFDDRESGDVIADHLRVTNEWLATNPEPVDAVVWPENSAEFNLPFNQRNLSALRDLVNKTRADFSVGSILSDRTPDGEIYTNSSVVLSPDSPAIGRYDKRFPVPFAEYMPHRSFYRALVPDLVDLVQLEYSAGTTSTVHTVGQMRAGHAICFDIIFDAIAVDMVHDGAEIIFAPTNNADFGQTDQSEQQLQIAKLRAVEMGRDLVHISTVATSEIVSRTGETLASVPQWQPGVMSAQVTLVSGSTPALTYGAFIAGALITIGLGGTATALVLERMRHTLRLRHEPSSFTTATSG